MKKIIAITAVSVVALFMGAQTASASWFGYSSEGDVIVRNHNNATVVNNVSADADTGKNDANGGDATCAGSGGPVSGAGTGNTGGDGGDGGDAGHGGFIYTGHALADAYVSNTVNSNETRVVDACDDCGSGEVTVRNRNNATVRNTVDADADTGKNDADGGDAAGAGSGGPVSGGYYYWYYSAGSDNEGGEGGEGGKGGNGGEIVTGPAESYSYSINVVNSSITRIQR